MAQDKAIYRCQQCGYASPKWLGRCPECQAWHSLVEEHASGRTGRIPSNRNEPITLGEIPTQLQSRLVSALSEWDRVLGGGLLAGSLVLLAGDPGIGKSTLLLQALSSTRSSGATLYASGEESPQQLKLRATRLGLGPADFYVLAETCLENVIEAMDRLPVQIVALDSIQTAYTAALEMAPGSVTQVRECASRLMRQAKEKNVSIFLVGHVTKEGAIAGPRVLEHLVDTVLYLEGDRSHSFRLLRAVKNRYGSTNEIGVFEMKENGLQEVPNPSRLLLAERPRGVPGSVVSCAIEGTRPLLVELQALVGATGWMQPRRTCMGVDNNRVSLLLAVLEKRLGFSFAQQDVFVNVVGGVRLTEPAADLAITTALMSTYLNRPVPADLVVWGEIGLTGEIRGVGHAELRAAEAKSLGFLQQLIPKTNSDRLPPDSAIRSLGTGSLDEVQELLFP